MKSPDDKWRASFTVQNLTDKYYSTLVNLPTADAVIAIEIHRAGAVVFAGETTVGQIKRPLPSLADWLYRENSFPHAATTRFRTARI